MRIARAITLADVLEDPESFTTRGMRAKARKAFWNVTYVLWTTISPVPPACTEAEFAEWERQQKQFQDPARITLEKLVKMVDSRMLAAGFIGAGPNVRKEIAGALAKHGYELEESLRAPTNDVPLTRDALMARVSDVVRRSGVSDVGRLVAALEAFIKDLEHAASGRDRSSP